MKPFVSPESPTANFSPAGIPKQTFNKTLVIRLTLLLVIGLNGHATLESTACEVIWLRMQLLTSNYLKAHWAQLYYICNEQNSGGISSGAVHCVSLLIFFFEQLFWLSCFVTQAGRDVKDAAVLLLSCAFTPHSMKAAKMKRGDTLQRAIYKVWMLCYGQE